MREHMSTSAVSCPNLEQVAADMGIGKMFGPPLHIASLLGKVGIVKWLLEKKVNDSECELAGLCGNGTLTV